MFAGGDHSFLTLNDNLKRKPQVDIPYTEELDFSKDDLLFKPDDVVQQSPKQKPVAPLQV